MDTLVCYLCHFINEDVIHRFEVIRDSIPNTCQIKWIIPTSIDEKELLKLEGIDYHCCDFDKKTFFNTKHNDLPRNEFIYCDVYENFNNFDNYWFIEYDCIFRDNTIENWSSFFNEYLNKGIDLLCCHFCSYDIKYRIACYPFSKLIELNQNECHKIINDDVIMKNNFLKVGDIYFSFLVNTLLSKQLLQLIYNYYIIDYDESMAFFEYVIPTIAKKHNLMIEDYSDKYTQLINYICSNPHYLINCGSVSWYAESKLQYENNILVHPIKDITMLINEEHYDK